MPKTKNEENFLVINPASGFNRHEEILIAYAIGGRLPSDYAPSYRRALKDYRQNKKNTGKRD